MLNTLRSVRPNFHYSHTLNTSTRKPVLGIRFAKTVSGPNKSDSSEKMEQKQDIKPQEGDETMFSMGEAYATRSEEEGFGGIYGKTQTLDDKVEHGNAPEYDRNQGSQVKEKEKGRNQSKVVKS